MLMCGGPFDPRQSPARSHPAADDCCCLASAPASCGSLAASSSKPTPVLLRPCCAPQPEGYVSIYPRLGPNRFVVKLEASQPMGEASGCRRASAATKVASGDTVTFSSTVSDCSTTDPAVDPDGGGRTKPGDTDARRSTSAPASGILRRGAWQRWAGHCRSAARRRARANFSPA